MNYFIIYNQYSIKSYVKIHLNNHKHIAIQWAQWDLNPWPPGYEPGALPG